MTVAAAIPVALPVAHPVVGTVPVAQAVPVAKVVAASVTAPELAAVPKSETEPAVRVSAPGKVPTVSWKNPEAWAEVKLSGSAEPQSFKLPEETRLKVASRQHNLVSALLWLMLIGGVAGAGFYVYTNPAQVQQWQALLITTLPESLRPAQPAAQGNPAASESTSETDSNSTRVSQENNATGGLESSTTESTPEPPVRANPEDREAPQQLLTSPRHASASSR